MKGYCSVVEVENYALTEVDPTFETQIQQWIEFSESIIDRETGRNFIADDSASDRLYDGNSLNALLVDDFVDIVSITINDNYGELVKALTTDDFVVSPYNSLPKRKIILKPAIVESFVKGTANITVNAKWGYSVEVPDQIKFAAIVFTAGIMNFGNDAPGEIKSETIGDYSVTYKDDNGWNDYKKACDILNTLKAPTMYV